MQPPTQPRLLRAHASKWSILQRYELSASVLLVVQAVRLRAWLGQNAKSTIALKSSFSRSGQTNLAYSRQSGHQLAPIQSTWTREDSAAATAENTRTSAAEVVRMFDFGGLRNACMFEGGHDRM